MANLDPSELTAAAMARMRLGKPSTYGGVIKNPALLEKVFISQTVPDVQPNTRIIAVCGITDYDDDAHPAEGGWFLSDFYAFNYLLRQQGISQTWMTTEEPTELVKKYKVSPIRQDYIIRYVLAADIRSL